MKNISGDTVFGYLVIFLFIFIAISYSTGYTHEQYVGVVTAITQEQGKYYTSSGYGLNPIFHHSDVHYYTKNMVHVKYGNGKTAMQDMKDITRNSGVEVKVGDKLNVYETIDKRCQTIVSVKMKTLKEY